MAATSPSAPRRVPPEEALPEPAIGVSAVAGGGLTAVPLGTAAGAAAGVATTRAGLPLIEAGAESIEKILEALARFFIIVRARHQRWIVSKGRAARVPLQDILELVALESGYQAEFERKVTERVRRDATRALRLPEEERLAAVRAILGRERVYARQRAEAMAVRAIAALDRVVLRRESPEGAHWVLDKTALRHTAGCRILAGHVFPWEVLDGTHPPFGHAGCRCYLRARGKGERVLSVAQARLLVARARAAEEREHG